MPDFSNVEDTLFVPMLGRIYASEHVPHILKDDKALELKNKIPADLKGKDTQTEYTFMASAVRSTNMDRYISDFMQREPEGVVVLIGAGLETTFYRNDDGKHVFYEVDLPAVTTYRKEVLGESDRDRIIPGDAFAEDWILQVRKDFPDAPILVAASGLFYYFTKDRVISLFRMLQKHGRIEMLFDAVNGAGMKRMGKYMEQVGHSDASMYFYVDDANDIAKEIGCRVLAEEPYYAHTVKKGLKFSTSLTMKLSDKLRMVKMVHLGL